MTLDGEAIAPLLEVLADSELADSVQVLLADDVLSDEGQELVNRASKRQGRTADTPVRRNTGIRAALQASANGNSGVGGQGVAIYTPTRQATTKRLRDMPLAPQMRRVMAYLVQHGGQTARDLEKRMRPPMKFKAIQSVLYALRHTDPPMIESAPLNDE